MPKTFYITTAIDYTNSAPHIGHAYEKVLADVIARYQRLKGERVFFLTGVDQHGQKVQQSAAKEGVASAQFVKNVTQKFVDLWEKLDVKYNEWAETTAERHKKVVREILQRLWDEKQIYKDKQAGYYSIRQEQFLTDKERGRNGEFGPEWGQVEFREEENYYFRLERHKQWLLRYINPAGAGRDAVIPDFRQIELRNAVEKLSGDLCISRPKSRLDWGIELPFDKDFVTYVWFDALTNYISFIGYDAKIDKYESQPNEFCEKWPALQIIGKDILIPAHGIYWLIMLHALGFPDSAMPQLLVHGWWNISGAKMSKSEGNVVDPFTLADKYGGEALRYYLMTDIVTGKDADFSEKRLGVRYNSDLANNIGNLLNRTLNMAWKYRAGKVTTAFRDDALFKIPRTSYSAEDLNLLTSAEVREQFGLERIKIALHIATAQEGVRANCNGFREQLDRLLVSDALLHAFALATSRNRLVDDVQPWKLAKDPNREADLDAVLYDFVDMLRIIAILISPVLPKAAHGIFDQLNWKMELSRKEERFRLDDAKWGGLPDGHVVGKPVPLFPRIEI